MCQLVLALINQAVGGDKGHHLTQFLAGHFKRMLSGEAPFAAKLRVAQLAFGEEALGVLTVLNLAQAFAHRLAAFLVHNLRARVVLAVFGIVGDGVIHRGDAAFVDEVHDELHFVAALKVSHFGGVTGFNEGFKTGLDELHQTAAEHGLFAEEVGFGFRAEGRFDDTGFACAVGGGVRKRHVMGGAGDVLVDRNELRNALAYSNSWTDVALGKQMSENMIDNGADVMFVYANELGLGVINGAVEKGAKVVGYSSDQTTIDPKTVVASIDFDYATMYVWAIDQFLTGKLAGHQIVEVGVPENVYFPVYTDNCPAEAKTACDQAVADLKAGKVDLKALFD